MKAKHFIIPFVILFLLLSCDLFDTGDTGTLVLKGVKSFPTSALSKANVVLIPDSAGSYLMHTKDIKFNFKEIYVSLGLVDSGISDDFDWVLIGEDGTLRSVEEVDITANDLPEGIYKSLKIIFGNEIIRYAVYVSDTSTVVEMASNLSEGSSGDTNLVVNYFSERGSFSGPAGGIFHLMSRGETFQEFQIIADQTTTIYWMIGDTTTHWTDFTFIWADVDGNLAWTPGVDNTREHDGPPDVPMWSFLVVEE
jgi:hypothetical protein